MAFTTPTNIDSSVPEVWAKSVLREERVGGFWGAFVGGPGSGAPIIQKTELLNKPGDLIHIQVTDPLTGAGQTGDTAAVEGNEENLATSAIKASPEMYRHGVGVYRRANKKSILELRSEARFRLREWMRNKIDNKRFELFTGDALPAPLASETYAPNVYVVGGGSDEDAVGAADDLTVASLQQIKLKLRMQQAKPVMIDGKPFYALVTHPYSTYQLKQEARYESWVREAHIRGERNPFFTGALAVIDGMVIYDHENVTTGTNAGAIAYSKGIAFGREAFVEALDEDVFANEDTFDYGNKLGFEIGFAFQPRRALELSSCLVYTTAEAVV
jgi:N4-gp56 family major capsid protein